MTPHKVRTLTLVEEDGTRREIESVPDATPSPLDLVRQRMKDHPEDVGMAERAALNDLLAWVAKWPLPVRIEAEAIARVEAHQGRSALTLGELRARLAFVRAGEEANPVFASAPEQLSVYCANTAAHDVGSGAAVVARLPFVRTFNEAEADGVAFVGAPNEWRLGDSLAPWLSFAGPAVRESCVQAEMFAPGVFRGGEETKRPGGYRRSGAILTAEETTYEQWDWLTWEPQAGGRPKFTFKCWECGEPSRASGKPEDMALIVEGLVKAGRTSVSLKELKHLFTEAGRRRNRG